MRTPASLLALLGSALLATSVAAATPNVTPGLWSHTNTMSMQGPMGMPPQVFSGEECITQADIDKGVDLVDMPAGCTLTQMDIRRHSMDYGMSCNMDGMQMSFTGTMTFEGERMQGEMTSEIDTPIGKMIMKMESRGERIGDC